MTQDSIHEKEEAFLTAIGDSIPSSYLEAVQAVQALSHRFHQAIAKAMESRINDFAATLPQHSLIEKREASTQINDMLRGLGLAIRCPETGAPAILVADSATGTDARSRFRMDSRDRDGRRVRVHHMSSIEHLELMPLPIGREPHTRYRGI